MLSAHFFFFFFQIFFILKLIVHSNIILQVYYTIVCERVINENVNFSTVNLWAFCTRRFACRLQTFGESIQARISSILFYFFLYNIIWTCIGIIYIYKRHLRNNNNNKSTIRTHNISCCIMISHWDKTQLFVVRGDRNMIFWQKKYPSYYILAKYIIYCWQSIISSKIISSVTEIIIVLFVEKKKPEEKSINQNTWRYNII